MNNAAATHHTTYRDALRGMAALSIQSGDFNLLRHAHRCDQIYHPQQNISQHKSINDGNACSQQLDEKLMNITFEQSADFVHSSRRK